MVYLGTQGTLGNASSVGIWVKYYSTSLKFIPWDFQSFWSRWWLNKFPVDLGVQDTPLSTSSTKMFQNTFSNKRKIYRERFLVFWFKMVLKEIPVSPEDPGSYIIFRNIWVSFLATSQNLYTEILRIFSQDDGGKKILVDQGFQGTLVSTLSSTIFSKYFIERAFKFHENSLDYNWRWQCKRTLWKSACRRQLSVQVTYDIFLHRFMQKIVVLKVIDNYGYSFMQGRMRNLLDFKLYFQTQ